MVKKIFQAFIISALLLVLAGCSTPVTSGKVILIKGKATVIQTGSTAPIAVVSGMVLKSDDKIVTGEDGVLVIDLVNPAARLEVQPGTSFVIDKDKLNISTGSIWTKVDKLKKNKSFDVYTPSAVVGVRGTKFYISGAGSGMQVICHCEGETHDTDVASGKAQNVPHDSLVFLRNGKRVVLGPDELKVFGVAHNHSVIDDSPLGKKAAPDPVNLKKMMQYVEKKFAELK